MLVTHPATEETELKMNSVSPPQPRRRGDPLELHQAAFDGSIERAAALLSRGTFDIDQQDDIGNTPLMLASVSGHSRLVKLLLNAGAKTSVGADNGFTALHASAEEGLPAVTKMLLEAGADLEVFDANHNTPLALAAGSGHVEVLSMLLEAGANPDTQGSKGETPLCLAAQEGHSSAVRALLRGKANPLVTVMKHDSGVPLVALDIAAKKGHSAVVRELVRQVGIEGCGGASRGADALCHASANWHVDVMTALTEAGVVDSGRALVQAVACGCEAAVNFLLQQKEGTSRGTSVYVNFRESCGYSPLLMATGFLGYSAPSPRIVRLLVDAGADTAARTQLNSWNPTPLELTTRMLQTKKVIRDEKDATEKQLQRLEGIRRLLLREGAVHAVSWLWTADATQPISCAAAEGSTRTKTKSTPLTRMLPLLRQRSRKPRVLLAALCRNWKKP